jgi:calcineurin-like phosphoesterase family protein
MKEPILEVPGRTFVTADTHFGQPDACASFDRPFPDTAAMQDEIIARFNAVIGPNDLLIHLGDFVGDKGSTKEKARLAASLRERLDAGRIVLVRGNHDPDRPRYREVFDAVHDLLEFRIGDDDHRVVCSHYPMRSWRGNRNGSLHLYGHTHGRLEEVGRSTDVGVDCWGFRPILLDDLVSMLLARDILAIPPSRSQQQPIRRGLGD